MLKSISCILVLGMLMLSVPSQAFILFDKINSISGDTLEKLNGAAEILDTSKDLMNEFGEGSPELNQFSKDLNTFSTGMSQLELDMQSMGYSKDEIERNLKSLSSDKTNMSQKMRSLQKSVKNVKKIKELITSITALAASTGGGIPDPANQAMLANQQQLLHIQIQKMRDEDMSKLDQKMKDILFKKNLLQEIEKAQIDILKGKRVLEKRVSKTINLSERVFQRRAPCRVR